MPVQGSDQVHHSWRGKQKLHVPHQSKTFSFLALPQKVPGHLTWTTSRSVMFKGTYLPQGETTTLVPLVKMQIVPWESSWLKCSLTVMNSFISVPRETSTPWSPPLCAWPFCKVVLSHKCLSFVILSIVSGFKFKPKNYSVLIKHDFFIQF